MASSPSEKSMADVKAALEALAGHQIDASTEQIEHQVRKLAVPVSAYSFTPAGTGEAEDNIGQVLSRSIVVLVPPTCVTSELLDIGGFVVTSSTGSVTLSINSFLCPNEASRFYGEPVNIIATPVSVSPFFVTVTHSLVSPQPLISPTDIQINIFAWDAKGAPAPNLGVNWRCRVPTTVAIF